MSMSNNLTPLQATALRIAALASVRCEAIYKIPALLSLAQWAEESGWGEHTPQCNCFGIKSYHGCHGTQTLQTHEYIKGIETVVEQDFATFASIADCFDYHAALLAKSKHYAPALITYQHNHDLDTFIRNIAPIYAPGNLHYASNIIDLSQDQRLNSALKEALQLYGVHPIS